MGDIRITNTLTGKKEVFKPLEENHVKMYACGVTVYDHCHIGHAMQAIYFDVIRNYLEFVGNKVTYVRNYTDVDDKIINKANELGMNPIELSESIIASSEEDMKSIGVKPATHEPKVSECIPEIIEMIEVLIDKGAAYATESGDVYYRVRKKNDYGKLSNRNPDDLRSGTRDLVIGDKEDALDFALWKKDETKGASWSSPWGMGRPGWHIECSVMSKMYLGDHFDIHGGGRDLVFPHHENEIAQSESANGCCYANIWMHSGLLTINKQKMSKSLGNHLFIKDFVKKYPGEVLRLAYLSHHYSSNVDFSEEVFKQCTERLLYFYETLEALDEVAKKASENKLAAGHNPEDVTKAFHKEMENDFGTVGGLRELIAGFKKANELLKAKKSPAKYYTAKVYAEEFRSLLGVFGLAQMEPTSFINGLKDKILPSLGITRNEIEKAITDRLEARKNKDWAKSDEIRDLLTAKRIVLKDTADGTEWTINF